MTFEETLYRTALEHGGGDSLIPKILPLITQHTEKAVREKLEDLKSEMQLYTWGQYDPCSVIDGAIAQLKDSDINQPKQENEL